MLLSALAETKYSTTSRPRRSCFDTSINTLLMYFDFFLLDLLPNRCDFDSVIMPPQRHKRTVYTAEQKSTLEATFRNKMYLSREEKATLASKLNVGIAKVQVCSGKYSLFS